MKFTIYSTTTGQILRSGISNVEQPLEAGEAMLADVVGSPATQIVDLSGEAPLLAPKPPPGLEEARAAARAHLAKRRWEIETGGIEVAGVAIATDRESQAMIQGALTYCTLNPGATVSWKSEAGTFTPLDQAALSTIALTVGGHVQACFAREAELAALIDEAADAGDLADLEADLATFW